MFIHKWAGFRSLPSRYGGIDGGFQRSSVEAGSSRVPSEESENTSGNPVSFSRSLLASERILPSRSPFPSQLKSDGLTAALELSIPQSNPGGAPMKFLNPGPLRALSVGSQPGTQTSNERRDVPRNLVYSTPPPSSSLRRRNSFSNHNTEDFNSIQPLARKRWSGSQPDLQANVSKETPRNMKLREAGDSLAGQPQEFGARNLDLEVDMMEFELSSLRQKQMESSFAYLEKERKWLEVIRSEGRKRKGELDDKIFKMEMDLAKTKSYFGQRDHCLLSQGFSQSEHVTQETLDVGQDLRSLQKSLSALKTCIKTLEEKRNEMVHQLKCVKEGEQISAGPPTATKSLEAKRERCQLQAAYKNIKQKNVALLQQIQHLSLELKHAQKNQEGSRDQISALKSELASNKNRANQQEEKKVLVKEEMQFFSQENEELPSTAAESHQRLGALVEKLHLLEEEKKSHANHVRALEDERTQLLEEKEKYLLERTAEWQGQEESRKALQESCDHLRESQIQLQKEKGLLQVHCQDLERQAEELGKQLDEQRSISQDWRNQWEDMDAALRSKGEELEKMGAQNQALQAKNAEWSLEKQRLQQLVRGLEEQLAEKDQALRDLRQTRDVERAALEMRTSSEPKITREDPGTSYEKGRPAGLEGKMVGNQLEGLRLQHHSVTEQLKELFRQRQEPQAGARKHQDGGLKARSSTPPQNFPRVLTTSQESLGLPSGEKHLEAGEASKWEEGEQSLRQQLKAKTDVISAMACEIQTLKEKNENLIQAKLRFQEQIQHIRQLSKRPSGKEVQVPRLSTSPGEDGQRARCHEILEVSSQKDEAPCSSHHVKIEEEFPACTEEEQKDTSSNIRMAQSRPSLLPSGPSLQPLGTLSDTSSASNKLLLAPAASPKAPLKHVQDEGALLRPRSPRLLSPKPFGPPRPWSPFQERAESPENGEL